MITTAIIETSTSGGLIFKSKNGDILHLLKNNIFIRLHSINPDAVVISATCSGHGLNRGIFLYASMIEEIDGLAFSGSRNDLMLALNGLVRWNVAGTALAIQIPYTIPSIANAQTFSAEITVVGISPQNTYAFNLLGYVEEGVAIAITATGQDKILVNIQNLTGDIIPEKSVNIVVRQT